MTDRTHAARRAPAPPDEPVALGDVGDQVLEQARGLGSGRSARTLTPGAGAGLKQTVLGLTAGNRLHEHRAPGPATIQVLRGRIRLGTTSDELELCAGHWALVPDEVHDVLALTDAAMLLTVTPGAR